MLRNSGTMARKTPATTGTHRVFNQDVLPVISAGWLRSDECTAWLRTILRALLRLIARRSSLIATARDLLIALEALWIWSFLMLAIFECSRVILRLILRLSIARTVNVDTLCRQPVANERRHFGSTAFGSGGAPCCTNQAIVDRNQSAAPRGSPGPCPASESASRRASVPFASTVL